MVYRVTYFGGTQTACGRDGSRMLRYRYHDVRVFSARIARGADRLSKRFEKTKAEAARVGLRFLVLVPLIIACTLISRAHIRAVGVTYDLAFPEYADHEMTEQNIQIEPSGMATVEKTWVDDEGIPHITFRAGEPGKGMVLVGFEDTGGMFELQTSDSGVLIVNGFDMMGWEYICMSLILIAGASGVLCLSAVLSLRRLSWYGYELAAYVGGALFFCLLAIQFAALFLSGAFPTFSEFGQAAVAIMSSFVEVMAIPVALIAVFVSLSNVVLLRREGRAFTNLLGVIATIVFAVAFFGMRGFHQHMWEFITDPVIFVLADSALAAVLAYGVALFLGVCITALLAALHTPSFPRDYLVILGCGLRADGTPTPLLAGRADAVLGFAERQAASGYAAPTFVPSGGQGSDEACSEAASMARYIAEHADAPRVLQEDKSTTTRENMAFSAKVIEADAAGADPTIAFSTTNYHVLRGYVFAHMAGMDAEGIAAPTKLYFWPNAFLREFVGMLAARAVPIVLNCLAIVALYGVLEYLLITR